MSNTAGSWRSANIRSVLRSGTVVCRIGLLLLVLAALVVLSGERQAGSSRAYPFSLVDRQRYGYVATSLTWREDLEVSQLRGGWYVEAHPSGCATSPDGMDRALLIRVLNWSSAQIPWLMSMVDSHPGSLWLVGNEPDCIWQDNLLPEDYAHIYHEIYTAIKGRDPTALVAPGGIVQPTPLRLQWLDGVLAEYEDEYGVQMPVDVWNIHNAILREARDDWGADIPPGFDEIDVGVWREVQDNDRLDIFEEQIWNFRQWMADSGYAGDPLIITEFGVLMPVVSGFDLDRVNAFMDATFEFLNETTDQSLGDPADGFKLVQRWAWFGLDNPPYDENDPQPQTFNGNLFDPYTTQITGYGLNYKTHTSSFSALDYVDLRPSGFRTETLGPVGPGETVNTTVGVEIQNLGSRDSGAFAVRLEYHGPMSGQLLGTSPNVPAGSSVWIDFELAHLLRGAYGISARADSDNEVVETTECDNSLDSTMVVPVDLVYFPMVAR